MSKAVFRTSNVRGCGNGGESGPAKSEGDKVLTNGGRVVAVSSMGSNRIEALGNSYRNAEIIQFDKKYYRKDLGFDL